MQRKSVSLSITVGVQIEQRGSSLSRSRSFLGVAMSAFAFASHTHSTSAGGKLIYIHSSLRRAGMLYRGFIVGGDSKGCFSIIPSESSSAGIRRCSSMTSAGHNTLISDKSFCWRQPSNLTKCSCQCGRHGGATDRQPRQASHFEDLPKAGTRRRRKMSSSLNGVVSPHRPSTDRWAGFDRSSRDLGRLILEHDLTNHDSIRPSQR